MQLIFMRGQISLEYLIIAIIALSLVSISLFALNKIRSDADKNYDNVKFNSLSQDFFNTVDEICALGNGNSRSILLSLPVFISSGYGTSTNYAAVNHGSLSKSNPAGCEISISGDFKNSITIYNDQGIVKAK